MRELESCIEATPDVPNELLLPAPKAGAEFAPPKLGWPVLAKEGAAAGPNPPPLLAPPKLDGLAPNPDAEFPPNWKPGLEFEGAPNVLDGVVPPKAGAEFPPPKAGADFAAPTAGVLPPPNENVAPEPKAGVLDPKAGVDED